MKKNIDSFMETFEQRLRDFRTDHKVELIGPDADFLEDISTYLYELYDKESEVDELKETIEDLKDTLHSIYNMASDY